MPSPGPAGGRWAPSARGGSPLPWSTSTHVWKSHVCTRSALGCAQADVDDGGRDEARAARVLDRHLDAELDGDVADQHGPRDPADPLQLDRDPVGDALAVSPEKVVERHDRLVEHERAVGGRAHRGALGVRAARLLERVLELACGAEEAPRGAGGEAPVRVGEEHDLGPDRLAHRREPLGVGLRRLPRP